jgi:hypothetical protein
MSFTYPDAVIYRLKCFETLNYYIGSTVDLENRIRLHKQKNFNKSASKSIIQRGNYKIKILEKIPCNVYTELFSTEQKYLDRYKEKYGELVLNKNNAFLTEEQKRELHRINSIKFYELHREKILEIRREKFNCVCGGKYIRVNKSTHFGSKKHKDYISKINENKI